MGTWHFQTLVWERSFTLLNIQIESSAPQDPMALALQIQTLTANIELFTRQNQEIR